MTGSFLLLAKIRIAFGAIGVAKAIALQWAGASWPLVALWAIGAASVTTGVKARFGATLLFVLVVTLFTEGFGSNHLTLFAILALLFVLADSDRHLSILPSRPGSLGAALPLFLLRVQLSIIYASAGLAKINSSWLGGDALEYYLRRAMTPVPEAVYPILPALALGAIALELLLAVLPWLALTRKPAIGVAVLLHFGMLPIAVDWLDAFQIAIFGALVFVMFAAFFERGPLWWFFPPPVHRPPRRVGARAGPDRSGSVPGSQAGGRVRPG